MQRLLQSLKKLTFTRLFTPEIQVVVVDNDPNGEAIGFCDTLRADFAWQLDCYIEPQRGISYARNRAVAAVSKQADFIAFVDDDETPEPTWLEELLLTQVRYSADVVHGPVLPKFQEPVPDWIVKGGFFEPQHKSTGQLLEVAYTNNVLVKADLLQKHSSPFDERFALTGGEDSYFFRNLYAAGCRIVWANDANVYETIPSSRTNIYWLLQRNYRSCLTYSVWQQECKRDFLQRIHAQLYIGVKGLICLGMGIARFVMGFLWSYQARASALIQVARGLGCLASLVGISYAEYRVIHRV